MDPLTRCARIPVDLTVVFKTLKLGQGAGGELSQQQVDTTHNREIPHANLFTEADSKAFLYFCVFLSSFFFFFFFLISPTTPHKRNAMYIALT